MIEMAAFRARYPHAWLPEWLDTVETVKHPSEYAQPGTQVWIAAIHWAMGDWRYVPLVQRDQERAREILSAFGPRVATLTYDDLVAMRDRLVRARLDNETLNGATKPPA